MSLKYEPASEPLHRRRVSAGHARRDSRGPRTAVRLLFPRGGPVHGPVLTQVPSRVGGSRPHPPTPALLSQLYVELKATLTLVATQAFPHNQLPQ